MTNIKKLLVAFLILMFLNSCGYTPRYALNKNLNFTIDLVELSGDREFNNFLKSKLIRYTNDNDTNKKKYELELKTEFNKNIKSRDGAGLTTDYELQITVNALIKSEVVEPKKIVFEETFTMKKFDDPFEEKNYEKLIKENFSDLILDRILFYLFKL